MTNHWKDIKNADVILVMGANPAENHPCGFKWALEARDNRGAKLVTIDPRFTRTSAVADKHLQIRPGSDIAMLGGFIRHILENDLQHDDYVRAHTNASFIVTKDFGFADGLFAGFDEAAQNYDKTAWEYERGPDGFVRRDPTLEHPRCVFQLLKRHYERYTPAIAAQIAGCSEEDFLAMADIICSTGRADRVGTIMYAVGWTMHTVGTQIIRTAAIMQLLLGNIGRPGGGINALRGHANVQGATDHAIVAGILPGYLKVPTPGQQSLQAHLSDSTPRPLVSDTVNYWGNYPKFYVSQMKAWFGDQATPENDFAYDYLAKPGGDATWLTIWDEAYQGRLEGFVALGFNPLLAGPDVPRLFEAMANLKWKVVIDPFMLDSAEFWKAPGQNPAEIETEVLYLPSSHWIERDGSFTNSGRWAQWKEKAVDPPIGVRSDTWILSELFWRVKELYQGGGRSLQRPHPAPHLGLPEPARADAGRVGQGDQRIRPVERRAALVVRSAQGRRHDRVRQLALLRQLHGSRQPDGPAGDRRPDRSGDAPRLGLQLAAQPAGAVQPRLGGRRREAVGPAAGGDCLEWPRVDRRRTRLRAHDSARCGRRLHHERRRRRSSVQ